MTGRRRTTRRNALKFGAIGSFGAVTRLVPMTSQAGAEGIEDCTTIDEPGEYELENDITGGGTVGPDDACIEIRTHDVTLEGNGYLLKGDGDGTGILVRSGGGNAMVRNLTVRGFEYGIKPELGSRATITSVTSEQNGVGIFGDLVEVTCTNSTIRENDGDGISLSDGVSLLVRDCQISDNGGSPVTMCCRNPVVLEDCVIVGNGEAVAFATVPGTRIEGTEIAESSEAGIETIRGDRQNTPGDPVRVTDCHIRDNDGPGISHDNGYLEVKECTLSKNRDGYRADGIDAGSAVLRYNNIEDNESYGAFFRERSGGEVDAECNYWGHESGPKHQNNPRSDPKGDRVTGNIDVIPWSVERIEDDEGVCIGGQERVSYISQSSFTKVIGEEEVACVPDADGWGSTFYIRREARNGWSDEGVFLDVPDSSQSFRGYLISAEADTICSGGPSGEGPWGENCCSWLFVNESREVQFDIEHSVHESEPTVAHEAVQPTNGDGDDVGLPLDLVQTTYAPFDGTE